MKKILALVIVLAMVLSTNVFAYQWAEEGDIWYVYDDNGEKCKNILIDAGTGVYYLDSDGKMVTGWWRHPETKKYYFFDNNVERDYGSMVFGIHTVDGYYRYFGDDGTLQTSDDQNSFKNVYLDFWADATGKLYYDNEELRDVSIAKSDYYSNTEYYTNVNLNNYYLANFDTLTDVDVIEPVGNGTSENNANANVYDNVDDASKKHTMKTTTGGTDYYVNEYGSVVMPDQTGEISTKEKLGPAKKD